MIYPVRVENGANKVFWYAGRLTRMGLVYDKHGAYRGRFAKLSEIKKIERFCKRKHLKYYIDNSYGKRSSDYRKVFFQNNPPGIFDLYMCAYCGMPVKKSKITVDHVFPVGQTSKNVFLQWFLGFLGINDVNDPANLVPACEKCNNRKGKKMGIWVIRGFFGKSKILWFIRWIIRVLLLCLLLYWLCCVHNQGLFFLH